MKSPTLIIILLSVTFTSIVSTIFGFAGQTIIGTFWGWFWVSWLVQFLGSIAYNSFLMQRDAIQLAEAEASALAQLAKISVKISCAYCQQSNTAAIQLNQRNYFKCEGCNQVNGISMQFMATAVTEPINSVKLPIENEPAAEIKIV